MRRLIMGSLFSAAVFGGAATSSEASPLLDIWNTSNTTAAADFRFDNTGVFSDGSWSGSYGQIEIANRNQTNGNVEYLSFSGNATAGYSSAVIGTVNVNHSTYEGDLFFWTRNSSGTGATKMIVKGSGNVGIGTTAPAYILDVAGTARATAWITPSDGRLKKDVVEISDALAAVKQLRGVRYHWRTVDERTVGRTLDLPADQAQIGFIAQEVEKVVPEAVIVPAQGSDGVYGLKMEKLIPLLVEAVKEEQAQIADQQHQIDQLRVALTARTAVHR